MKRLSIKAILLAACFSVSAFSMNVTDVKGTVVLVTDNISDTLHPSGLAYVGPGQKILTCALSEAKLVMPNGTYIRVKPNTEVKNIDDRKITLSFGVIFVKAVNDVQNNVVIQTPEITTSVKGTSFAVKEVLLSQTSFAVLEGSIVLESMRGEIVTVPEGLKLDKKPGQPLGSPEPLANREKEMLLQLDVTAMAPAPEAAKQVAAAAPQNAAETSLQNSQAPAAVSPAPGSTENTQEQAVQEQAGQATQAPAPVAAENAEETGEAPEKAEGEKKEGGIQWEMGLGMVTVEGKQWQRINISPDIPIWKFGICLDIELFIDDQGNFSKKGWEFDNNDQILQSLSRKIKYVRFGKSGEPLFIKLGAIDNVTLGYGLIMSGFANTYEYPEFKRLGMQFEVNGISSLKLGLQTVVMDLQDIKNKASVVGARFSFKPFAPANLPLLGRLEIGVSAAGDENQYKGLRDSDGDSIPDVIDPSPRDPQFSADSVRVSPDDSDSVILQRIAEARIENALTKQALSRTDRFALACVDIGLPIIQTKLLGLTVYGQYAMDLDYDDALGYDTTKTEGWGIAAPGVLLNVGPANGCVEFRHFQNRFRAAYFNSAYEHERLLLAGHTPITKESTLDSVDLNGIFASAGMKLGPIASVTASFEYLMADADSLNNKSMTASASLGDLVVKKIPKLASAGVYFGKSRIGRAAIYDTAGTETGKDGFFDKSPYMFYGYSIGFELAQGIVLVWDRRTTYVYDEAYQLKPETRMNIQTAIKF